MLARLYSFKLIVCLTLLWLILLAFGLAIYSSQVYRDLSIENQIASLQSVMELESREIIADQYHKQNNFAFDLQKEA